MDDYQWDVFISHASEDKDSFVRRLAIALERVGLRVWYDEHTQTDVRSIKFGKCDLTS